MKHVLKNTGGFHNSKASLNFSLMYNGNVFASIPLGHSVTLKETTTE